MKETERIDRCSVGSNIRMLDLTIARFILLGRYRNGASNVDSTVQSRQCRRYSKSGRGRNALGWRIQSPEFQLTMNENEPIDR